MQTLIDVIRKALVNIRSYHEKQVRYSWFDSKPRTVLCLVRRSHRLRAVGVYVPGGKAVYPSSVLMNVIPAKVAGVRPHRDDNTVRERTERYIRYHISCGANEAGVDEIYKVGGAQAIAALAYGTESIPKVDKIVGPGNILCGTCKESRIRSCQH